MKDEIKKVGIVSGGIGPMAEEKTLKTTQEAA